MRTACRRHAKAIRRVDFPEFVNGQGGSAVHRHKAALPLGVGRTIRSCPRSGTAPRSAAASVLSLKSNPATARRGRGRCLVAASPQGSIASPSRRGTAGAPGKAMRPRVAHLSGRMWRGSAEPKQKSRGQSTRRLSRPTWGDRRCANWMLSPVPLMALSSMQLSSMQLSSM